MPLQTRQPTGRIAWPLVLVEGEEKAGKSYMLAQFASSPRVGRTFVLDTGDGTMDEYGSLGPYEILVHDGTWGSMLAQIEAAVREPRSDPSKPNVVGIDSGTLIWQMLRIWTDGRARNSRAGRAKLQEDPDAEIDASMNLWNDAKARWGRLLHLLRSFDGIGVILANGAEVTKVENGQPTKDTTWSVDVEKSTPGVASAWVRCRRDPRQARVVGVRSLTVEIPEGGLVLPAQHALDHLVFEILGAGSAESFAPLAATPATVGVSVATAKMRLLDAVRRGMDLGEEDAKAEAARIWALRDLPSGKDADVRSEVLTALLLDVAEGRIEPATQDAQEAASAPAEPEPAPTEPEPPSEPQEAAGDDGFHRLADGSVLQIMGRMVTADEAIEWLNGQGGDALRDLAGVWSLKKSGSVGEVRQRIKEAFGLSDPLPEVIEVPDHWAQDRCICGEPIAWDRGNYQATITHLDPTLNADHTPSEPF